MGIFGLQVEIGLGAGFLDEEAGSFQLFEDSTDDGLEEAVEAWQVGLVNHVETRMTV